MVRGRLHAGSVVGQMTLLQSVVGRGPLFLWGIFAAVVYHLWGPTLRTRLAAIGWLRLGGADLLLAAILRAEAGLLRWTVATGTRWMSTPAQPWHIMNGALWTAFLLLLLLFPLASKGLFSNRVLARLGIVSYSIYLIHLPFFDYSLSFARSLLPATSAVPVDHAVPGNCGASVRRALHRLRAELPVHRAPVPSLQAAPRLSGRAGRRLEAAPSATLPGGPVPLLPALAALTAQVRHSDCFEGRCDTPHGGLSRDAARMEKEEARWPHRSSKPPKAVTVTKTRR